MAKKDLENNKEKEQIESPDKQEQNELRGGTYEIIQNRLKSHCKDLSNRLGKLNIARKEVFGAVENKLLSSDRISTENNCVPRDMVSIGDKFIFGYNVFVGLRTETVLEDVFAIYQIKDGEFKEYPLDLIKDSQFETDFKTLYKYYRKTVFAKFSVIGTHLFMVFRVGNSAKDVKTFKWLIRGDTLEYLDNRSDHEFVFPAQQEFEWTRTTQDMFHEGKHSHISIEDRVFVETINGDLTIKIEDNTETGEGIYSEAVENPDQTLSDALIYYAIIGNVILLKIKPYEEEKFRYFVYNEKVQKAIRLDAIHTSCVLLPENHGLIFPKGYYLHTGSLKQFDTVMDNMVFEKRIASPNGEDYCFIFYNRDSGVYVLLSYNIIEQKIATPVVCNGYSFFEDGKLIYFRADEEPKKHHAIQMWQTPYYGLNFTLPVKHESELYKIGNKDIVRCMAECTEIINLINKEEINAALYVDIVKKSQETSDAYFWIDSQETFKLNEPLVQIKDAATLAIDEYEKVLRTKENTRLQIEKSSQQVRQIISDIKRDSLDSIDKFVNHLTLLRSIRGEIVSLRDLRYADMELIDNLETEVTEHTDNLSASCVEFLLDEKSLDPYREKTQQLTGKSKEVGKVTEIKELQEEISNAATELEMLTDIVSNLKIEDATQTIAIIDNISKVYSEVNQVKVAIKNKLQEIGKIEGQAEFSSQIKLIDQSAINYLDICDTPEKCDEYLGKLMIQLENLESKFADFEEFVLQLTEKREELYNAFESRKVQLVSQRNQRAVTLMASAERILKGIDNRVRAFTEIEQINGYFASDMMIERINETIKQLNELGDNVKAEDIKGRLKTIHQDCVRQLKDKLTLYEDGENIIRMGNHRFAVNKQSLAGTIVRKKDDLFYHLTSTGFFERIEDEIINQTKDVWAMEVLSETESVYRAEYLAYKMFNELSDSNSCQLKELAEKPLEEIISEVQTFMGPRYEEGYIKGVHDHDAAKILLVIAQIKNEIGLLRYSTQARALARVFWLLSGNNEEGKSVLAAKLSGMGKVNRLFNKSNTQAKYIEEIAEKIESFVDTSGLFDKEFIEEASEYLYYQLAESQGFVTSGQALSLKASFEKYLRDHEYFEEFTQSINALDKESISRYRLLTDWIRSYLIEKESIQQSEYTEEVAVLFLENDDIKQDVIEKDIEKELTGLAGSHKLIDNGTYKFNYCHFMAKLNEHDKHVVPKYQQYQKRRNKLVEQYASELNLDQFQAQVLPTFVRNKLIDKVYLPLIGDNLAKQIGAEGKEKRTDRQGLLLLISPPGYGKTTLMEYVSNRLGLAFVKINGPAIGSRVMSLDPKEAPNAAAMEELKKLNLAFEMGDNVMIYVDDIQHTNPEFLQKFISLCDAQRKVEGVYKGKSQTYDLRGKRVCIVMAGNPYTESGEKFKIPDMLANRADTYNIGDIVGDNYDQFVASYIENCLTANPVLEKLTRRSQNDAYSIMKIAQTQQQEGIDFEGNYTVEEVNEYVSTMKKLFTVRDVVLKVNSQYISSAGQADEYRIEPTFLLQGSYRNMNRIAGRVLPVMNDEELWTLIYSAYEQDAQTLTTGAESNLLKFRELTGRLTEQQTKRWEDIKKTFQRNLLLGGQGDDQAGRIIGQMNAFTVSLDSIKDAITNGVGALSHKKEAVEKGESEKANEVQIAAQQIIEKMNSLIEEVKTIPKAYSDTEDKKVSLEEHKDTKMLVSVLEEQFHAMETWLLPMSHGHKKDKNVVIDKLIERFVTMSKGYERLIEVLKTKREKEVNETKTQKKPVVKKTTKNKKNIDGKSR